MLNNNYTEEELRTAIIEEMTKCLEIDPEDITDETRFIDIGVKSAPAIKLISKLRRRLGLEIEPTALFEAKDVKEMVGYLSECDVIEDDE